MVIDFLLLDVAGPGPASSFAGLALFFVIAAIALLVFFILRKTLRLLFRLAILVLILILGFIGSAAIFFTNPFGTNGGRPKNVQRTQPK
jgi:glucan phosphoethanolaminetransferase (alkaline phosphatase superfamily)